MDTRLVGVISIILFTAMGCASESRNSRAERTATAPAGKPAATARQSADTANMEILLDKIKADKKLLVAKNMELTDAEAAKFWPLYDQYQQDLDKINQRMANTILEYADAYNRGPLPDQTAAKLLEEALATEDAEVKLKRSYAAKFEEVVPASKAARYLQIETKIRSLLRLDLARNIPLVH